MSNLNKMPKIDLSLLKRLVAELETYLVASDNIKELESPELNEYIVEMSKASGLCQGIMSESLMLMSDIQSVLLDVQGGQPSNKNFKNDLLEKILGPLKGGNIN